MIKNDDDARFVLDTLTRRLSCLGRVKKTVVQGSHKSERLTFEFPRYIEGMDISLCDYIEVHYKNTELKTHLESVGFSACDVISIEEDKLIFSWLITRNATRYKGSLDLLIKLRKADLGGNIDYEYNTEIYSSLSVSEGLDASDAVSEDDYIPDIIAVWGDRVDTACGGVDAAVDAALTSSESALAAADRADEASAHALSLRDGVSPVITVADESDGHTVTVTDVEGDKSFKVKNGEKGERGEPFRYEDFTKEQLDLLKGADGTITFEGLTDEQRESLRGESAYEAASSAGYEGTHEKFCQDLSLVGRDDAPIVKIWENASPESSFYNQDVYLPTEDYAAFLVMTRSYEKNIQFDYGNVLTNVICIYKRNEYYRALAYFMPEQIYMRRIIVHDGYISFMYGERIAGNGDASYKLLPVYIYGIRA